ncbi:MAG TPA: carboxypeptidase regulatory-like domain-containing protein [Bryobacteraceae bacterium]|nr:carboxypeptidase regulatory-like domain-containing protein [Bryobacteraceae bacterium]
MRRTLALSLLTLVCTTGIRAQAVAGFGAITGIVKDMYGDGIPDTTIVLTNPINGVKRTVMTSDDGIFDAPALIPSSSYSMKVTRKGYADWELKGFDVAVGETLNFNITLWADKTATAEEALGALAPVQDTKTGLSALVTAEQLNGLPTNGRLLDTLILLAPAVTESASGVLAFRGELFTNSFLLDGIDVTNSYFLNRRDIAPYVPQETVAEMQVLSAAGTAEFGHASGGMVNAVTNTATNKLHVAAYDFFNQNSWNAPNPFATGFSPTGQQHHGGASAGLPVASDELFVYANAELVDGKTESLNRITNPLLTNSAGTAVLSGNCTATSAQCTQAANFINSQLNVKVPSSLRTESGVARIDFRPAETESITLSANVLHKRSPNGLDNAEVDPNGGLLGNNATYTENTRYARFGWTHVASGTAVNEARGYWFEDSLSTFTDASLLPSTGALGITVAGTPIGANPNYPSNLKQERFGGADTFTLTQGSHTLKLGGEVYRNDDRMEQLRSQYGTYNYASFSNFALDFSQNVKQLKNYMSFVQTFGNAVTDLQTTGIHAFAQDTWKPFPSLIFNFGVRWEKTRLPKPTEPNPNQYQTGFIPSPNVDFAPRIGISYRLDNRTVVRLGGGMYYQPFPGQFVRDLFTGGGLYQTNYILNPTAVGATYFPKLVSTTNSLNSNLVTEFYTAAKFRNPYTEQATFAVERRLTRLMALALSYVESRGIKMWSISDQNIPGATSTAETYTINDASGNQTGTYPTLVWSEIYGRNYTVNNEASSHYRGATAQLRTALTYGLSVQASYTWSHANDDVSGPPAYSTIPSNSFNADYRNDWGASAVDQRSRAVVNWTWAPTVTQNSDPLSRFLLNGWQLSGIGTYASTMYQTALVQVIGQQFSGVTMAYISSLNGTGGWPRVPFYPVNSLPIGNQYNVDARITRMLPFTERLKGALMFEVYNAANRQNNTSVNTIAFTATSGVLKPVAGVGIPNAAYGYPFGTNMRRYQIALRLEF